MSSFQEQFAIGIDLGATKIASVLLSATGEVIDSSQVLTLPKEGPQAVLDKVADQILDLAQPSPGAIAGVGIGSPGKVDSTRGVVYNAVNLGWTEVNLSEEIAHRIHRLTNALPVWIQKDANLSALGEYYFGACQSCMDFVYLGIGSGLGAGVISGGRLITGGDSYAADVGHLSIDPEGPLCVCGGHGCAETVASGPGLVRITRQMLAHSQADSKLSHRVDLTPADVLAAANEGDALALKALSQVGRVLGMIMSACTAILNPSRYVVGGGLGLAGFDFIVPAARQELLRRTIPESRSLLEIVPSQVESPAIGAASLVWYARAGETAKS
ncbi:MAG TPA: ROK family protein [Anaerolineales bacterium]|nr:ROK family protein [Anaerolineales bacterium]